MKGWDILAHSLRQVLGNLEGALRVSAVLYLGQIAVGVLLAGGMFMGAGGPQAILRNGFSGGLAFSILLVLVVSVFASLWIAVGWHRYILLGEKAELVPTFRGDRIWAYFLRGLGYTLVLIVAGAVWGGIVGYGLSAVFGGSTPLMLIGFAFLIQLPIMVFAFRMMAGLPGAALGADVDFMAGWKATAGHTSDIVGLVVLIVIALIGVQLISWVLGHVVILNVIFAVIVGWVQTMVGVSILTTLYGHYIEQRPLV